MMRKNLIKKIQAAVTAAATLVLLFVMNGCYENELDKSVNACTAQGGVPILKHRIEKDTIIVELDDCKFKK